MALCFLSRSDSRPRQAGSDDRALLELGTVSFENLFADRTLLSRTESYQTYNPRVRVSADDCQLTEVLVDGDEDPALSVSARKDFFIPGIPIPLGGPDDIMTSRFEGMPGYARNAGVEEELHAPTLRESGSMRSCPTSR